ncbi:MAG: LLM class flavin-dependent oxidoreductase [archaeon]|nr:LLM class flavin-dependent oxidoreductase [archaeon]MCP8306702.1 LLM class flavin-dependent oxidoreductase [archaeon]
MKYGLHLNSESKIDQIVRKGVEAERLGLDSLWICDMPSQRYGPVVASAIASRTRRIQIGLGFSPFLHTPQQIVSAFYSLIKAYGERFELCLVSGDKNQLQKVGILRRSLKGIPDRLIKAKVEIERKSEEQGLNFKISLGAQGPKMVRIAPSFDGVHLNFCSPRIIEWAMNDIGRIERRDFQVGIFAPSYVYATFDRDMHQILRRSSTAVILGSSDRFLKIFEIYEELHRIKGRIDSSTFERIPQEIINEFSISMPSQKLKEYLSKIATLGVEGIVFSYPQDYSIDTIRDLARSLTR